MCVRWMLRCTIRKSSRRAVVSVASRTTRYTLRRRRLPTGSPEPSGAALPTGVERRALLDPLGLGGGLGERDELPAGGDVVEELVEAGELVVDRYAEVGLAGDELAGDAVLVGVGEVDAVELEVPEGAAGHGAGEAVTDRAGCDDEGGADGRKAKPGGAGDGELDERGLAAAPWGEHRRAIGDGRGGERARGGHDGAARATGEGGGELEERGRAAAPWGEHRRAIGDGRRGERARVGHDGAARATGDGERGHDDGLGGVVARSEERRVGKEGRSRW